MQGRPLLLLGVLPPTLNPKTYVESDASAWIYASHDLYVVKRLLPAGRYTVGVQSHPSDALPLHGTIVLRTEVDDYPCLGDCYQHGQCQADGECACDSGFAGQHVSRRTTCERQVEVLMKEEPVQGQVGVGKWWHYKVVLTEEEAAAVEAMTVQMHVLDDDVGGVLLLRKDTPPVYGEDNSDASITFKADYEDTAVDQAYHIISVGSADLSSGTWHLAVHHPTPTSASWEDDHVLRYTLTVSLNMQGDVSCPHDSQLQTCSGVGHCNLKTNSCECPPERLGAFCQDEVRPLSVTDEGLMIELDAKKEEVFYVADAQAVVLYLSHAETEAARALVVAKLNAMPSLNDGSYDHHDLLAVLQKRTQQLVLPAPNKGSTWYIKLQNPTNEKLRTIVSISVNDGATCEEDCSGQGTCVEGVCQCDAGFVRKGCQGRGIITGLSSYSPPPLTASSTTFTVEERALFPSIEVGRWGYWSVDVACDNTELDVVLEHLPASTQPSHLRPAPMLFVRHNDLPLMFQSTTDYYDHYAGTVHETYFQRIVVTDCVTHPEDDDVCNHGVVPMQLLRSLPAVVTAFPFTVASQQDELQDVISEAGTLWATGAVRKGKYYVGVFNDILTSNGTLMDYRVRVRQLNTQKECTDAAAPAITPVTAEPTTEQPTTKQPTTAEPTTAEPTTAEPTTNQPTTAQPTIVEPTSKPPTPRAPVAEPTPKSIHPHDDEDQDETKDDEDDDDDDESHGLPVLPPNDPAGDDDDDDADADKTKHDGGHEDKDDEDEDEDEDEDAEDAAEKNKSEDASIAAPEPPASATTEQESAARSAVYDATSATVVGVLGVLVVAFTVLCCAIKRYGNCLRWRRTNKYQQAKDEDEDEDVDEESIVVDSKKPLSVDDSDSIHPDVPLPKARRHRASTTEDAPASLVQMCEHEALYTPSDSPNFAPNAEPSEDMNMTLMV